MTIIYAILIFCFLIFFHELGHFTVAKLCGVKVNEFSLGMGPAIFKKQKGETLYSIRAFPIGGFCAMEGEDEDSDDERAFNRKPAWKKALIVIAGAFMNLLLAVIILASISFVNGMANTTIDTIVDGSPAQVSGLEKGDTIVAINKKTVESWTDIYTFIGESKGETLTVTIEEENGQTKDFVTGVTAADDGRKVIGIKPEIKHNVFLAAVNGGKATWQMTVSMVDVLKQLFTGEVSTSELTGPVGIVAVVNDTASLGFIYIAYLMALISLNLAIVNMLPLPALDGGRLVFIVIRKITGKAITDEMEAKVHFVGIVLLLMLMLYVTWNDIVRFILPLFS